MAVDLSKYRPVIDAIITSCDPDEVSPKKIRRAVQDLFGISFDEQRKEVNEFIIERFNDLQENPLILISKRDMMKKDEHLALRLQDLERQAQKKTRNSTSTKEKVRRKKRKTTTGQSTANNSLASRKWLLSPQLKELLGEDELPRTQVVKLVWDYIKSNNLQNEADRREILCDDKMRPIFGNKVTMFSMNKVLSKHLFNRDEILKKDEDSDIVKKDEDTDNLDIPDEENSG
ncbi:hypothetical protein KAFR_0B03450 [Kazachstania africana CBS 2517]|uniref:Uncharacterized protein n=1 Tax=Kazachstania africana (strain ATCC 22294 / BCRC 22015 / CBS 2517 / CECT 1963 / NBRC 1671 / NRRL Y-8276) TaxID=1071382 RepID=H2AQJ2_KAZAF|nr:hypothetical protein KAFR_0B03450 [Kazachstania africana CBS 2517]CCF56642.1 hypothetical protein KAFR_0B03450 [Kazachstania africana CBS 2517]